MAKALRLAGILIGIWIGFGTAIGFGTPTATPTVPILSDWQAPATIADYHEQIQPTPSGYLRWHQFPVRVAIQPIANPLGTDSSQDAESERDRRWIAAVRAAIAEWQIYFPLQEVNTTVEDLNWDIYILRSRPPAQRLRDGTILPSRLADTRYEYFTSGSNPERRLRFWIRIGNQQGPDGLQATARHELGHALGLWGHSTNPQDVMYPAQTGLYPPISDRDLKTLQWLYNLESVLE